MSRVAPLPRNLEKPGVWQKKPSILNNFQYKNFHLTQKTFYINKIFFVIIKKNLLLKNTFKVTLQYFFNVFILLNTVSHIKIIFKLEIDPKMCTF